MFSDMLAEVLHINVFFNDTKYLLVNVLGTSMHYIVEQSLRATPGKISHYPHCQQTTLPRTDDNICIRPFILSS